ncbi:MAG: PD-(D/E)XK nuclease family protein [Lachnospiraceae bacterium]
MSIQYIIGGSGTGKSNYLYRQLLEESMHSPQCQFYMIVPEQSTMQVQEELLLLHPDGALLNIDVLSFQRLAFRVFEEAGEDSRTLLEETGKSLILQKVAQEKREELSYLGSQMHKPGYIEEVKSLLSEFMQYDISSDRLEEMAQESEEGSLLQMKLQEIGVLYRGFEEFLAQRYITSEEVLDVLRRNIPDSVKLKDAVVVFDGFTGFTPLQNKVVYELLRRCSRLLVTVTMDCEESLTETDDEHHVFHMSRQMIRTLSKLAQEAGTEILTPVLLGAGQNLRLLQAPGLAFLERNIFRYNTGTYEGEAGEITLAAAEHPLDEMQEAAREIAYCIRTYGYRYKDIAVVTGNLEDYGDYAAEVFAKAGIPCFIDETHSISINPFLEALQAVFTMFTSNFSYDSVFHYLRCGMSGLERQAVDRLENYVIALGIRGFSQWERTWERLYHGLTPEELALVNQSREMFVDSIRDFYASSKHRGQNVLDITKALYYFMEKAEFSQLLAQQQLHFENTGQAALAREYEQVYDIVLSLLEKMVDIVGEDPITFDEYAQMLKAGLESARVKIIPLAPDQVLVGDIERTRIREIKMLFFVGINDGIIPKNPGTGGIVSEAERRTLKEKEVELAPGARELMFQQRFYLYLMLTKPSERLYLSFSKTNAAGDALLPSYLLGTIRKMFPQLRMNERQEFAERAAAVEHPVQGLAILLEGISEPLAGEALAAWKQLYGWYFSEPEFEARLSGILDAKFIANKPLYLSKEAVELLYQTFAKSGVTGLERYEACHFAYFLQYGLRIKERAEHGFTPMDLGTMLHDALEFYSKEVTVRGWDWSEITPEEAKVLVAEGLDASIDSYSEAVLQSSARNGYIKERARRLLERTVWVLGQQFSQQPFTPEEFELVFPGGRIDRIDEYKTQEEVCIRVVDYKTGARTFDLLSVYYGLQLQLLWYLQKAAEYERRKYPNHEVKAVGAFYYQVADPMIRKSAKCQPDAIQRELLKELSMTGIAQESLGGGKEDISIRSGAVRIEAEQMECLQEHVTETIETLKCTMQEGDVSVAPYELGKEVACTWCPYMSVCGFDRKVQGYAYRRLRKYSNTEIWNLLECQRKKKHKE